MAVRKKVIDKTRKLRVAIPEMLYRRLEHDAEIRFQSVSQYVRDLVLARYVNKNYVSKN